MRPTPAPGLYRRRSLRRGFTVIELLIVVTIIAILLSMSAGAVFLAQESARAGRTESMVSKLHNIVIDRWESFRTRRLLVTSSAVTPLQQQANRLTALRELMRMEMPDRYEDLVFTPTHVQVSVLRHAYLRRVDSARIQYNAANSTSYADANEFIEQVLGNGTNANESAECLFLWLMSSTSADERAEFKDKEYADTNNNFMPEFIDAWGMPIRFLRWSPGFVSEVNNHDPVNHHDPFDPYSVQMGLATANIDKGWPTYPPSYATPVLESGESKAPEWGFAILPLIYSPGPDREYGIHELHMASPVPAGNTTILIKNNFPYARYSDGSGGFVWRGEAHAVSGDTVHFDNIHNHNPVGVR